MYQEGELNTPICSPQFPETSKKPEDQIVREALRYIAESSDQMIRANDVVRAAATTRRILERRFKESLSRTIADEIGRFRIERAKRYLVDSDAALKAVALDAGFTDANHFDKTFVRVEGVSPTQFRQRHRRELASP